MKYQPISCDFHSHLESFSTKKEKVRVVYLENGDQVELKNCLITDLYTKNKEEFVELNNEKIIRLDHLVSVNDIQLSNDECGN